MVDVYELETIKEDIVHNNDASEGGNDDILGLFDWKK